MSMSPRNRWLELGALALILIVAAFLRWYGLAWDNGYLFHPDERQIILVVSHLALPASLPEFFSPNSPLNPKFFAYGSFPIYLLRLLTPLAPPTNIVGPWQDDQLARWVLFGRTLSGLFDLGTIILTYILGRRVYNARVGLVAAACVAVTVLHIQLSHFYAVDTLVTFLTLATLYCTFRIAQKTIETDSLEIQAPNKWWLIACGITFGLALATKITAITLVFPIAYACYCVRNIAAGLEKPVFDAKLRLEKTGFFNQIARAFTSTRETWRSIRQPFSIIAVIALLIFILTQPYVLIDWYTFGRDVFRETFVARGWLDYPYTRQYANTLPLLYQWVQSSVWGMGLPLGLFAWVGGGLFLVQWWKTRKRRDTLLLSFALLYFLTIALQYAKYLRYLLPLLPVLYIIAACAWLRVLQSRRVLSVAVTSIVLASALLYSVTFIHMYTGEHPWLTASRWIYQNIPAGKTLLVEQWDDALPTLIPLPQGTGVASEYTQIQFPMYDDDTDAKRALFAADLVKSDLVILASQRLYASIGRLPARYPLTTRYYEKLFNGELGFEPVLTARNDPNLFGITIRDDPRTGLAFDASSIDKKFSGEYGSRVWDWGFADESFSVYDHPQPIVFQKVKALSAAEIDALLKP